MHNVSVGVTEASIYSKEAINLHRQQQKRILRDNLNSYTVAAYHWCPCHWRSLCTCKHSFSIEWTFIHPIWLSNWYLLCEEKHCPFCLQHRKSVLPCHKLTYDRIECHLCSHNHHIMSQYTGALLCTIHHLTKFPHWHHHRLRTSSLKSFEPRSANKDTQTFPQSRFSHPTSQLGYHRAKHLFSFVESMCKLLLYNNTRDCNWLSKLH